MIVDANTMIKPSRISIGNNLILSLIGIPIAPADEWKMEPCGRESNTIVPA